MTFRIKVFLSFLLYGLVLALAIFILSIVLHTDTERKESLNRASNYALETNKKIDDYLQNTFLKLDTIDSSKIFSNYYNTQEINPILNSLFLDLANTSKNIMQLRFMDNDGNEQIRIDKKSNASKAFIVDKKELQNKKSRYYFKAIHELEKGKYWYSKIDLNKEHGKIEFPIKPVLRVGKAIYKNNKKIGILIINIFMDKFLKNIMDTKLYSMVLLDKDGYTIVEQDRVNNWSRYLNNKKLLDDRIKDDLDSIVSNDTFLGKYFYATKINLDNTENIKLVVIPNIDYFKIEQNKDKYNILWILFASVLLSLPISYYMSRLLSSYKEKVDKLNKHLNHEIDEKDTMLSLYNQSNAVLFKWNNDKKRTVYSVTENVKELMGYTKKEFESNEIIYSECIHEDDLPKVLNELKEAIKYQQSFISHKPYRMIIKSGEEKWVLGNTLVIRDDNNHIINFLGYIIDISH